MDPFGMGMGFGDPRRGIIVGPGMGYGMGMGMGVPFPMHMGMGMGPVGIGLPISSMGGTPVRIIIVNGSTDSDNESYFRRPSYSISSSGDRASRLRTNIMILYHQTDREHASLILSSGEFRRGDSSSMAGSGIYFAISKRDTDHKAKRTGVYLQARVMLGNTMRISSSGDRSITYSSLLAQGYDSVLIPRPGGDEYVVYNKDQVSDIQMC